jgi:hypothetical protein
LVSDEDQVLVVPLGAGQHPLAELGGLVPVQLGDERQRERQCALAPLAIGLLVDQATAADPEDAAPDRERVVEEVDVLPLQREGLGLAQTERQGHAPAG